MKLSDQITNIKSGFEISNHKFVTVVANSVIAKLSQTTPGLRLQLSGKNQNGKTIKLNIIGNQAVNTVDELEKTKEDVRRTIDALKNESVLLSILDY